MSPAGFPLGLPSTEIAARSGDEAGPAHKMFKAFFVAQARKVRVLAERSSGDIRDGYKRRSQAAARFAAAHHKLAKTESKK
jgi:hypothetical protein